MNQEQKEPSEIINKMGHLGGFHIEGDAYTIMPDVWDWLITTYNIKSIVDIGCARGHSTKYFEEKGINCLGIEGIPTAISSKVCSSEIIEHDYTKGKLDKISDKVFDLGWCAEFVEHVEEQYVSNFMHTYESCKHVCITHGLPGQDGYHHVNCQTTEYWIDIFNKHGFDYDEKSTDLIRSMSNGKLFRWGRNTLTLFHKR